MFRRLDGSDGKMRFQDIETERVYNELPAGGELETQEEEQESALDELLGKVDLDSPLLVEDASGNQVPITRRQFIKYYLPKGATEEEQFHCFNQTKAAGLNPLIRGECHYPRFGDAPLSLYTGYPVYLRKAYTNGLEHLECEFEFDENYKPISVTTTLYIEERDRPFIWQTWYDEVEGQTKGQTNWRWKKAPKSQLRKCGVVDTLRYSGLLSKLNLPLILEEMSDPTKEGFRTLTQAQHDARGVEVDPEAEAELGPVNAADHQIDMSPFRKKYFGILKELGMSFAADEARRHFNKQDLGVKGNGSISSLTVDEWGDVFVKLSAMQAARDNEPKPEPDPPGPDATLEAMPDAEEHREPAEEASIHERLFLAEAATRFLTPADIDAWCLTVMSTPRAEWSVTDYGIVTRKLIVLPELYPQNALKDSALPQDTQTEPEEEQEQDGEGITKETRRLLIDTVANFPDALYQTVRSQKFKKRAQTVIQRWVQTVGHLTEAEAQLIIASLEQQKAALDAPVVSAPGPAPKEEPTEDEPLEDGMLTPDDALAEAMSQANAASEREAERVAAGETRFQTTPEWAELNLLYNTRLLKHFQIGGSPAFETPEVQTAFFEAMTGVSRIGLWLPEHFALADAGLDVLGIAQADAETPEQAGSEPTAPAEPTSGTCTDDDYKELGELFTELLPGKQYAMGSTEARDLIRESKAVKGVFTRIKNLTTEEVSGLKLFLNDKIGTARAAAEEKAKAEATNQPKVV